MTFKYDSSNGEFYNNNKIRNVFSPFRKDITNRYIACNDLQIPIKGSNVEGKYAFIAIFDNSKWMPVDFGEIRNSKAYFNNIGRNIAYIILGFINGKLVPISSPFLLKKNGNIEFLNNDESLKERVCLYRKYPASAWVKQKEVRITGGRIEASNIADFSICDTLFSINDHIKTELITITSDMQYRYWRYFSPDNSNCNIAELQFYKQNEENFSTEKIIANSFEIWEGDSSHCIENLFDGDHLTSFDAKYPAPVFW